MQHRTLLLTLDADELSVDTMVTLASGGSGAHASLYLPTHAAGRDVMQDPIRFRRLLGVAASELDDDTILEPLRDLGSDDEFWGHGSAGLGLLVDEQRAVVVRLSDQPPELAVVSDRFHLKPLLSELKRVVEFEVLALSQNLVRLVRSSRTGVEEIDVPDLPRSMHQALQYDDREPQLMSHASGRAGASGVTAAFHGQGDAGDAHTSDLRRFLGMVDRAMVGHRDESAIPLVLAGVDEIVGEYRAVTRCRHVVDVHLHGNPDRESDRDLVARARPLFEPITAERESDAREAFLAERVPTVGTVRRAVLTAADGMVASIFVPADREHWGRWLPDEAVLIEHETRRRLDHDLADVAAIETLRHGGEVFVVPAAAIPGGGPAAATLRY